MSIKQTFSESNLKSRLCAFIENEAKSCSMDYGCITPLYVYRTWGGQYTIEEIDNVLTVLRKNKFTEVWTDSNV